MAVLEKAYAHYRSGADSYASLNPGGGHELNVAFGAFTSFGSGTSLVNDIFNKWNTNGAVTLGINSGRTAAGNGPLVSGHAYTLVRFVRNSAGTVGGGGTDGTNDGSVTLTVAQLYGRKLTDYSGRA